MYLKTAIGTLFFLLPVLGAGNVYADEYLLLSNMPPDRTTSDVRKLVEAHGKVRTINCINIKFSNRMQRSCYVLMWSTEKARNVVAGLNGKSFDGKELYAKEIYPLPCLKDLEMS